MSEHLSVEERLARIEGKQAIRELMASYAYGCDNQDRERFLSIWAQDAHWNLGEAFGAADGRDAIEKVLESIWVASPETRHWITDITVDFTAAGRAAGDAHTICYIRNAAGDELFCACDYANEYVEQDGGWAISKCLLTVHWWKTLPFSDLGS
ncbi:unannotated protein [freshwater metagenome]|uniref:Unannotated protein n=1 Tax=freshwater metagenome TaxID=449393 RepID=A0A6J7DAB6_9ZZZZ|nr:hypothetical protein [Actinomycetota bacterium]